MNLLLSFGVLSFALSFCSFSERLKQIQGNTNNGALSNSGSSKSAGSDSAAEKISLTPAQQAVTDASSEIQWDAQGILWKLPAGWKKMSVLKESLNYGSPNAGFLIASVSVMPDSFPSAESLVATYDSALEQLKQGKYEKVRYLEIDGVKGVEWTEAMPEDKNGPRRHQWIAFRRYQGQNQQLNIMLSTGGSSFDKRRDDFSSIMYSMKIPKG